MATATTQVRRGTLPRLAARVAAVFVLIYAISSAGLYWAMTQPPDAFGRLMKHVPLPFMIVLPFETLWKHARGGQVHVGEAAPGFALPTLDRASQVQLASFKGVRPVVLVFGSYT